MLLDRETAGNKTLFCSLQSGDFYYQFMWSKALDLLRGSGVEYKTLDVEKQCNQWKGQGASVQILSGARAWVPSRRDAQGKRIPDSF